MIPVALLLITGSVIYYAQFGLSVFGLILCTLENTVMSFIARPTLSAFFALRTIDEDYSTFERAITHVYGAVLIIAPILTTTAVLSGFQSYVRDFFYSLKMTSKGKMYVIGDGNMGGKIAEKYADKYFVHYLMPAKTENKVRLPYLRRKVWAFPTDYGNLPLQLKECKLEKAACVVLDFKNWFENLKGINEILEYLMKYSADEPTPLCIINAPVLYRDVFDNMYIGLCKKYGRPETVLDVSFVNVNEVNAKKFFEDPELTVQPENRHHILLIGIGKYGSAVLSELARYMMRNGQWGTIEVFDRSLEKNINDLMYSSENVKTHIFREVEPAANAKVSCVAASEAGPLQANYYQANVGEFRFTADLEQILEDGPLTEVFFCIDDISVNFECYRMVSTLLDKEKNESLRIYFRVSKEIGLAFDALELSSDQFRRLPDDLPDIELFH